MPEMTNTEETVVVAKYMSRHDAEIAKSFLEDRGIKSFVAADDTHVPMQIMEGARLIVMEDRAESAREALADADMLPHADADDDGAQTTDRSFYLAVLILVIGLAILAYLWYRP